MDRHATRYEIEIDVLERQPELSDHDAIALLCSEFQRAINAAHFTALSEDDPQVDVMSRTVPQEGVARYALTLEFVERRAIGEAEATALVHSEFTRAVNASYFIRIEADDPIFRVVARGVAVPMPELRRAA